MKNNLNLLNYIKNMF